MSGCCGPQGYDRTFDDGFARRTADRYRRRGLDRTARRIVDLVAAQGLEGASVLEVGGGVGSIQVELLRRGAARAVNLELSTSYETEGLALLAEHGLSERAQRRIVDIATAPDEVEPADVVVLHRVVCCYPDHARLIAAVAEHARRQVVLSHPPRNVVSRAVVGAENVAHRLRRSDFRMFAHSPADMRQVLEDHGFRTTATARTTTWYVTSAQR